MPILLAIPLLLIVSAFFSGAEVAIFSLKPEVIRLRARETPSMALQYTQLLSIFENPKRILVTILIGNTLVNVAISVLLARFTETLIETYHFSPLTAYTIDIVVATFIILVFGEIVPKVVSIKHAERLSLYFVRVILFFQILFYPLSEAVLLLTAFVERFIFTFRGAEYLAERTLSQDDIETIAKIGLERTNLEDTEKELFTNLLDFRERQVRRVMIPRTDIVAISVEESLSETIALIMKEKRSRLPLYENDLDNIIGVVYAKDLIQHLNSRKRFTPEDWRKIARQPIFVPETQHLDDVLREFQRRRMHLAIVVDEYGGTSGLVTLEDVIQTIIGESASPVEETAELSRALPDGSYWFDASLTIEEANDILGKSFFSEETETDENADYNTLGGLVLHLAEDIPDVKSRIPYRDMEIEIDHVEGNRIASIILRPISKEGLSSTSISVSQAATPPPSPPQS